MSISGYILLALLVAAAVGLGVAVWAWARSRKRADRATLQSVQGEIERDHGEALEAEQGKTGGEAWSTYKDNFGE